MSSLRTGFSLGLVCEASGAIGWRVRSISTSFQTPRQRRWETVWLGLIALVITWFYWWTIDPQGNRVALEKGGQGYYNLLTRGFLKGQTALDREVDPALAQLKDPYDVTERAGRGLHDASYYKGRYFIYFGATPAVTLFAPLTLLTGRALSENFAVMVFSIAGFWISALLLLNIRRQYFSHAPMWVMMLANLALGLATMVPPLLRRPSIWEVPIAAAYAFFMLTLWCVWRSISARRAAAVWLALGSLAMGLAVGARPTYLLASAVLLAPLAWWWSEKRTREGKSLVMAALVPVILIGVGLAAYNYARFGKITEFGQTYQMAGEDIRALKLFSLGYLPYSFRIYILSAAGLTPFFPFITVIDPPKAPGGQFGIEDPYGLLPCLPWVILALMALIAVLRARSDGPLRWFVVGTLTAVLATMAVVFCFGGACGRYMVDFAPGLVLLAGVGALFVVTDCRGWNRRLASVAVVILAVWSAGFGTLASFQHNALFQAEYPEVYHRVAKAANWPGYLLGRIGGVEYGPVEMEVIFPKGRVGKVEPLVVTGKSFRSDYVYVHYLADNSVRFGYEHTNYGGKVGPPMHIEPGVKHTLRIDLGSLYPPPAHPYFNGMDANQARIRQRMIRVTLDGAEALRRSTDVYDAVSRRPDLGTSAGRVGFNQPFSGQLLSWKIVADAAPTPEIEEYGPLAIRLTWPRFTSVHNEPLVCSGAAGSGNLVYVKYQDAQTVVFGYDHWGVGGFESEPVKIEPGKETELVVDFGALQPPGKAGKNVVVQLDGKIVLDRPGQFHPCAPDTIVVGANPIGASTAGREFTGTILQQRRVLER